MKEDETDDVRMATHETDDVRMATHASPSIASSLCARPSPARTTVCALLPARRLLVSAAAAREADATGVTLPEHELLADVRELLAPRRTERARRKSAALCDGLDG